MRKLTLLCSLLLAAVSIFAQPCGTCDPEFSNNTSTPIISGVPALSDIAISGHDRTIEDLNVYVRINHSFIGDLDIQLLHVETGTTTKLFQGTIEGCGANINVTYNDETGTFTPCGGTLSGCYSSAPLPGLTIFNGESFEGTWSLIIHDQVPLDDGTLVSWCLMPTLTTVECAENPVPTDGKDGFCTATNTDLSWSAPSGGITPTGYKISIWHNNAAPVYVENNTDLGLVTNYAFTTALLADTTYYWQVTPYDEIGDAAACDVWSFKTNASPDPVVDIVSDSMAVCVGDSVLLNTNISEGNVILPGVFNFLWTGSDPTKLSATNVQEPKFSSSNEDMNHWYRLVVSDDSLCQGEDSIKIFIKQEPLAGTIEVNNSSVCAEEAVSLSNNGYFGNIDWHTSIDNVFYSSLNSADNPFVTVFSTGVHYVRAVVSLDGCLDSSNMVEITVHPFPDKPLVNVAGFEFCDGDSLAMEVTNYISNLNWNDGSSSILNYAKENGDYFVWYTDPVSNCATVSDTVVANKVTVDKPVLSSLEEVFCEGENVTLSCVNYTEGLTWNDLDNTTGEDLVVTETGNYYVRYVHPTLGCIDSSEAAVITVNPLPVSPMITQSMDTLFSDQTQNVVWIDSTGFQVGEGPFLVVQNNGLYYAVHTNENGCVSTSDAYHVTDVAVERHYIQAEMAIYPNPSNGILNVLGMPTGQLVRITDLAGKTIKSFTITKNNQVIDTKLSKGVYLFIAGDNNQAWIKRLVIN